MIKEKMSILISSDDIDKNPIWYDLNKCVWNKADNLLTASFSLAVNNFGLILSLLLDKKLDISVLFEDLEETINLSFIEIVYLKIQNYAWNETNCFLPECTIQFRYNIIDYIDKIHIKEIDKSHINFLKQGKWSFSLIHNNYAIEFKDFNLFINFERTLFPIEFMCANNFQDTIDRDQIYHYFNNVENIKLVFNLQLEQELKSINIENCHIDFMFKNKDIGNYSILEDNLVVYGGADIFSKIILDNDTSDYLSLLDYIEQHSPTPILMYDKNGNLAIEL